jgi:hypothetical protein
MLKIVDRKPHHVIVAGTLVDIPIMHDFLDAISEVRQILEGLKLVILLSDIVIPEKLVDLVVPTITPLTLSPGPVEGYYRISMDSDVNDDIAQDDDFAQDEYAAHTGEDVQDDEEETEQDNIDRLYADLARIEELEAEIKKCLPQGDVTSPEASIDEVAEGSSVRLMQSRSISVGEGSSRSVSVPTSNGPSSSVPRKRRAKGKDAGSNKVKVNSQTTMDLMRFFRKQEKNKKDRRKEP